MFIRVSDGSGDAINSGWYTDGILNVRPLSLLLTFLVNPQSRGSFKIKKHSTSYLLPQQLALTKSFHKINLKRRMDRRPQINDETTQDK